MSTLSSLIPGMPVIESPLFPTALAELDLSPAEREIAEALNVKGYAVIDFPDADIDARIERIKKKLGPDLGVDDDPASIKVKENQRIQDAWQFDEDVKAIAINANVMDLLGRLYGRRAVPFQTLNFPVGTQQHAHSDSIHFSCLPERFMCGVWLAMEDIHPDAGPLMYYPGSHRWPILSNLMLGTPRFGDHSHAAQQPYEAAWRAMIEAQGIQTETFLARKGQALIWTANLLHGGSPHNDHTRTRWSQVTHYYFENCTYYTPAFSEEALGRLELRQIKNIATGAYEPNMMFGAELPLPSPQVRQREGIWKRMTSRRSAEITSHLPRDFDPKLYLLLNPDVAAAGVDPAVHYQKHGRQEGRAYSK